MNYLLHFLNSLTIPLKPVNFPEDMKKTEISPIFKRKDDMIKDNYRPISLLQIFSKVFQTIVAEQLMEYFKDILIPCYVHTERSMVQNMF